MIPEFMDAYLRERLPERTWENRLVTHDGMCFLEFNSLDIDRLARLDIEVDRLGPQVVVCMWVEDSPLEIGGYLVVDNLAMGSPSMGGIRMLPNIIPSTVYNLARGMTLKNAAANLPYGGGKSGIVAKSQPGTKRHAEIIKGFAHLIREFRDIYLPGPDVGTSDADMKIIAIENGLDEALSKPAEMGGNRIDQLGAAAGGTIVALQALLVQMERLKILNQFSHLHVPHPDQLTVIVQGFGAVGAHASRMLCERIPGAKIVGISDVQGYLFDEDGLPVELLFKMWQENSLVTRQFYDEKIAKENGDFKTTKYSNSANDLLRESSFCLIPASPIANYLDIDQTSRPCITSRNMGDWSVIIEGANTYSPLKSRLVARERMEREVYRQKGVLIATDYLVNSGGVIFAAQEHLIKTPENLRIPAEMLGDQKKVDAWIKDHKNELQELAEKRRNAAEAYREKVISCNMRELVDLLISDPDILPCQAAEKISIRRVASSESDRTSRDIMIKIETIDQNQSIRQAADLLIRSNRSILAVVSAECDLAGVVTEWDITKSTAMGIADNNPIGQIMSTNVIYATPEDTILELIRKMEYYEITALPVVENGCVLGMISTDLLARGSLLRLLQSNKK